MPRPTPIQRSLDSGRLVSLTRFVAADVANGKYPLVEFDVNARWHQRLYRDLTVDIWLIGWLPSRTQLHDHGGSGGSFTVVSGELAEAVYVRSAAGAGELQEHARAMGATVVFDSGYVHDVRNLERGATVATDDPEPAFEMKIAS